MTPEELQRLEKLEEFAKSLSNSTTIPKEVDSAFRKRFSDLTATTSTKVATTEGQDVDEAGAATYSVLKNPDVFLKVNINGSVRYIPAYD